MIRTILAALCTVAITTAAHALTNTTSGPGPQSIADGAPSQAQQANSAAAAAAKVRSTNTNANTNTIRSSNRAITGPSQSAATSSGNTTNLYGPQTSGSADGYSGRIPVSSAIPGTVINGGCNSQGGSAVLQLPVIGLGGTIGGTPDLVCQSAEIGRQDVAFAYLCLKHEDYRKAASYTKQPCPQDAPSAVEKAAPTPAPILQPARQSPAAVQPRSDFQPLS